MSAVMVRTQIQLTSEQSHSVKNRAAKAGVSISDFIRQCVDAFSTSPSLAVSQKERIDRAVAAAGKFSSGKHDISRKHDDYLAEAFGK